MLTSPDTLKTLIACQKRGFSTVPALLHKAYRHSQHACRAERTLPFPEIRTALGWFWTLLDTPQVFRERISRLPDINRWFFFYRSFSLPRKNVYASVEVSAIVPRTHIFFVFHASCSSCNRYFTPVYWAKSPITELSEFCSTSCSYSGNTQRLLRPNTFLHYRTLFLTISVTR